MFSGISSVKYVSESKTTKLFVDSSFNASNVVAIFVFSSSFALVSIVFLIVCSFGLVCFYHLWNEHHIDPCRLVHTLLLSTNMAPCYVYSANGKNKLVINSIYSIWTKPILIKCLAFNGLLLPSDQSLFTFINFWLDKLLLLMKPPNHDASPNEYGHRKSFRIWNCSMGNTWNSFVWLSNPFFEHLSPFQSLDSCWKSRSWNAKANVHPSWFPCQWGAVDAESCVIPQIEVDQQHFRQTRPCK